MDVDGFVRDGYTVVRGAFDAGTAAACREVIWSELAAHGIGRDPATWTRPALRIDCPEGGPFVTAGTAPALSDAYDILIGAGRWTQRGGVGGTIPVRFPTEEYPGEVGYHIEGSYEVDGGAYWTNVRSRGRGLLALFLFSDVGPDDAPTRLVTGSHRFIPPLLAPGGERGMPGDDAVKRLRPSVLCRRAVEATGAAGDVFLCHPFVVHTATWPHRGTVPRMMAQPGVEVLDGFALDGSDPSPVARAIVESLEGYGDGRD
ncbi:hypothetical protein F4553_000467 [Allocatelliglobosispora scoriae]|uniref:Phytanoyl-CoA dioxygenase n=1 Tax=Allocatelliglobosispora scoriae TaxID=643052 RepID=A0A841BIE0_9ACTN|nr:phytanoyl-CoA dioxygenase [Allocatelliglobosispora scoriae]MBB5867088.1 hypothetical protein [Allocatelliglobosispora scoriae]